MRRDRDDMRGDRDDVHGDRDDDVETEMMMWRQR